MSAREDLAVLLAGFWAKRLDQLRPGDREVWLERADCVIREHTAPLLEEAAADAWDEGYGEGYECGPDDPHDLTGNPHRARREDAP